MFSQALPKALLLVALAVSSLALVQPPKIAPTISCEAKSDATFLYQGHPIYGTDGAQVGWSGPYLGYEGSLVPFKVQSSICNSTALGLSAIQHPKDSKYPDPDFHKPIKLYIVDQPGKCLALQFTSEANTHVVAADCTNVDLVDAQAKQFWIRIARFGSIFPYGSKGMDWQLHKGDHGFIIANPSKCFPGQTCQTDKTISLTQNAQP